MCIHVYACEFVYVLRFIHNYDTCFTCFIANAFLLYGIHDLVGLNILSISRIMQCGSSRIVCTCVCATVYS